MMRIITISGDIGGGKSAVSKCLENTLGYAVTGTGSIQREIAKHRGVTTLELNKLSITDPSIDEEIDSFVVQLGKTRSDIIIDSRLAWHFIPQSFKAFLTVAPLVGAQRVFADQRAEEKNPSLEQTLDNNRQRQQLEIERFQTLYGVSLRDFANYDTVIDTSYSPPAAISAKLAELYQTALMRGAFPRLWVNARRLVPTRRTPASAAGDVAALRTSIRLRGFDNAFPIACARHADTLYIRDGHKRALAAHLEGVDLIPCALTETAQADAFTGVVSPSWQAAWLESLGHAMPGHS
jgi:cytidylate kinase